MLCGGDGYPYGDVGFCWSDSSVWVYRVQCRVVGVGDGVAGAQVRVDKVEGGQGGV